MRRSQAGQAATALSFAVSSVIRSPRHARRLLRAVGADLLDRRFAQTSPLPLLPAELASGLHRHEIVLPPLEHLSYGNQDLNGLVYLVSLARLVEAEAVFEIGTYNGFTALTLARNLEDDAVVHTLDLPRAGEPVLNLTPSDVGHLRYLDRCPDRVYERFPEAARIVQHLEDSALFDFSSFASTCDLVYVDGAHSYEYVASDTEAAFRIVRPNGVIVWDDYGRRESGVWQVLHSLRGRALVRLPGSRLVAWLSDDATRRLEARRAGG